MPAASTVWTTSSGNRRARVSAIPTNLASSPDDQADRHRAAIEQVVERCCPSRARLASWWRAQCRSDVAPERPRGSRRRAGIEWQRAGWPPPFDERRKVPLDELGELVVRGRPSSTSRGRRGRGADEGQRPHSLRCRHAAVSAPGPPSSSRRGRTVGRRAPTPRRHGVDGVVGGVGRGGPAPWPARSGTSAAGSTRSARLASSTHRRQVPWMMTTLTR